MAKDLVSVIIPIYRVEQYLRQCIESVLSQRYSDIEVILVDDGSPDGCGAICDEYAGRDPRVTVIHKENGGLSSARNAGIDIARGRYLAFVDSDDYVSDLFISDMMDEIDSNPELDMVMSMFYNVISDENGSDCTMEAVSVKGELRDSYTGDDIIRNRLSEMRIPYILAWNKLYRCGLFDNVRYEDGAVHEDELIFRSIMERCSHIAVIDKPLTYHRIRQDSIMTGCSAKNAGCALRWMNEEIEYYRKRKLYGQLHRLEHMMCSRYVSDKRHMDAELREQYRDSFKRAVKDMLHAGDVRLKTKVHYMLWLVLLY